MDLALVAQSTQAELGFDQEADFQRRRRALVRHACDRYDDAASIELIQRRAELLGRLRGIEVMCFGVEVGELIGNDSRSGGNDQLLVAKPSTTVQLDGVACLVDAHRLALYEFDACVEEASFWPAELVRSLVAERDVHEAGLVDVATGVINNSDAGVSVVN